VSDLERQQLRASEAGGGEQLEHEPMIGMDELHNHFHHAAGEGPRAVLVLLDALTVRQRHISDRVVANQALAPGGRERRLQGLDAIADGAVGEFAPGADRQRLGLPLSLRSGPLNSDAMVELRLLLGIAQPADESGNRSRRYLAQAQLRREIAKRVPLHEPAVLATGFLAKAAPAGPLVVLDPVAQVLMQGDARALLELAAAERPKRILLPGGEEVGRREQRPVDRPAAAFLPGPQDGEGGSYSEHTAREIDLEVRNILQDATEAVREVLLSRRAALEAIAFQVADLLDAMAADCGIRATELRVDGGAAANNTLMQIQANLLGIPVARAATAETTAVGAATGRATNGSYFSSSSRNSVRSSRTLSAARAAASSTKPERFFPKARAAWSMRSISCRFARILTVTSLLAGRSPSAVAAMCRLPPRLGAGQAINLSPHCQYESRAALLWEHANLWGSFRFE